MDTLVMLLEQHPANGGVEPNTRKEFNQRARHLCALIDAAFEPDDAKELTTFVNLLGHYRVQRDIVGHGQFMTEGFDSPHRWVTLVNIRNPKKTVRKKLAPSQIIELADKIQAARDKLVLMNVSVASQLQTSHGIQPPLNE
ncbi:hypothetical protein [Microvirga calopogonii]|uniref:hypothetical protein n=1 Tax=Microvirga calopogonii TaxID=2078013 RepID=UPI0013B3F0BE|nr:hypothetical protein [Microvirga calopogonii]